MADELSDCPEGAPVGRRVVLGLLGLGALGMVGGSRLQDGLSAVLGPLQARDPTGLIGMFPVGDTFRYYTVTGSVPEQDASSYRLAVGGLVQRPGRHTLAELRSMPQTTLVRDFQCVTGWRVADVPWVGVRLGHLLDLAGPTAGAEAVRLTSFDGAYSESLTLEQARRPDVLVALQMLDAPVSHDHGGPVQLYVAPMYGYKSLKWLSGIEITGRVVPGYSVRWVHGVTGALVLLCAASAAVLYNAPLQVLVGHRPAVELVHVWSGFALPVPVVAGLLSGNFRADLRRLDRFTAHDWRWLRSRTRRDGRIPVGKFNAGQKLNGSVSAGAIAVLLLTGTLMYSPDLTPIAWRTGATLVHDWSALAVGLLVLGHISFALRDPVAMRSLRTGTVPEHWARREHGAWAAESTDARGDVGGGEPG